MPFLSETLYYALPGKNETYIANTKFPEPNEVYLLFNCIKFNVYINI